MGEKHAPTPWKQGPFEMEEYGHNAVYIFSESYQEAIVSCNVGLLYSSMPAEANAELIVRAVNAH